LTDTVKALEASVLALQAEIKTLQSEHRTLINLNKSNLVCKNKANCGKTGHLIEDCFQLSGGKQGQYPAWWRGKRTTAVGANAANFTVTPDSKIKPSMHYALSASFDHLSLETILEENKDSLKRVALVAGNIPAMLSCSFADSGCTIHFFKNKDIFSLYKSLNRVISQSSKEGTSFTVLGTGNVELRVVFKGSEHTLMFHDALHAPDITANLLSISRMDIAGWSAVFGNGRVQFFNKDKTEIFGSVLKNGLYLIHGSFSTAIPTALTAHFLKSPMNINIWHQQFTHFGVSRVKEASKLIDGLEIIDVQLAGQCKVCILANLKCHTSDDEVIPEMVPLCWTNIDIWGPSRIASEGGALYAMKFHDSGTSHQHTFFLKDQLVNTILDAIKMYKLESEKITGKTMIYVCMDNTPEFKGTIWANFFKENGIIHTPTAPYSSASNGMAEHSIGISMSTVRAMLNDSSLPKKWWAEAWAFADYVENLLPSV
jgi:hypothetical protein